MINMRADTSRFRASLKSAVEAVERFRAASNPLESVSFTTAEMASDWMYAWHALSTPISGLEWKCSFCNEPAMCGKVIGNEIVDVCERHA